MANPARLQIKNWNRYQHYKDRNPPWIKLATNTFGDYDFSRLQDGSKLLAIAIWTIAASTNDGTIAHDFGFIKQECHLGKSVKLVHLNELIEKGFLIPLAECKQNACLETETEKRRDREEEIVLASAGENPKSDASFCAGYVLEKLPWTGREARWAYEDQLVKVQKATGARMEDLAELMVQRWKDYSSRDRPFKKGVSKFITEGIWAHPEDWDRNGKPEGKFDRIFAELQTPPG